MSKEPDIKNEPAAPKRKREKIPAREKFLQGIEVTGELLEAIKDKMRTVPGYGQSTEEQLDDICSLLGQEILSAVLAKKKIPERSAKLAVLLKRQDQLLKKAAFQRETCEKFVEWYADERARGILESRATNAEKIEQLGKLIYGKSW